jgi:hypothetical protein
MSGRHVDDAQIQSYLDDLLSSAEAAVVRSHLQACASCREQVLFYQKFYQQMAGSGVEPFSPRLEDRILHTIQGEPLGFLHKQLAQVFGGALAFMAFIMTSTLFMNYDSLLESLRRFSFPAVSLPDLSFLNGLKNMATSISEQYPFLLAAAAVMVAMLAFDQLITHIRSRLASSHK